jgi:hypothetical protein
VLTPPFHPSATDKDKEGTSSQQQQQHDRLPDEGQPQQSSQQAHGYEWQQALLLKQQEPHRAELQSSLSLPPPPPPQVGAALQGSLFPGDVSGWTTPSSPLQIAAGIHAGSSSSASANDIVGISSSAVSSGSSKGKTNKTSKLKYQRSIPGGAQRSPSEERERAPAAAAM